MKNLLIKFLDLIMSGIERGFREEKPFISDLEKEEWQEQKREYYRETEKHREEL